MACYRYIEANPVRARMVVDAGDYHWSSYAANALGHANPLVVEHDVYKALGGTAGARQAQYCALFAEGLGKEIVAIIRDATQRATRYPDGLA